MLSSVSSFATLTEIPLYTGHWVGAGGLHGAYQEEEAVVVYLRQSFQGQETLTTTTLRSMGLVR
jgi:hypothetical protein